MAIIRKGTRSRSRTIIGFIALVGLCGCLAFLLYTRQDPWQDNIGQIAEIQGSSRTGLLFSQTSETRNNKTKPLCDAALDDSATRPQFRTIEITGTTLYVYSAFLVNDSVRIIALKERKFAVKELFCGIRLTGDTNLSNADRDVRKASVTELGDHQSLLYTAADITCPLQKSPGGGLRSLDKDVYWPGSVGLASETASLRRSVQIPLEIRHRCPYRRKGSFSATDHNNAKEESKDDGKTQFTVCSSILHSNFSNAAQLVEAIEMSRLLGAGRVVFFKSSVFSNVDAVLDMYVQRWESGKEDFQVVALPWELPEALSSEKLPTFGKMAAINDCLNRYRQNSRYLVFTDLDEHIITRQSSNWSELMAQVSKTCPGRSGYQFQSTIFRRQWPSPAEEFKVTADEYQSRILGHTQREDYFFPMSQRSKMIVDPSVTRDIGIAWRTSGNFCNVTAEHGLLQEYKEALPKNEFTEEEWKKSNAPVADLYAATTFGKNLSARLKEAWSNLGDVWKGEIQKGGLLSSESEDVPQTASPVESRVAVKPSPIDVNHQFHAVEALSSVLLVYAALWEETSVRLVAIKTRGARISNMRCVFYRSADQASPNFSSTAKVTDIEEHHGARHTAAYITCPVPAGPSGQEDAHVAFVGLLSRKVLSSIRPKVILPIDGIASVQGQLKDEVAVASRKEAVSVGKPEEERKVEFTVCVPAMFTFGRASQLVEKIEMSRLLGAERVVLYNFTISSDVDAVLRMYAREWAEGRDTLQVKVYQWNIPSLEENGQVKPVHIHMYGQMVAIDHCLHRYRQLSRYIIFDDLDEFIIPVRHDNLSQLVAEREKLHPGSAGFLFQSTVFNMNRPSPAAGFEADVPQFGSNVLGLTSRDDFFFRPEIRSKVIVNPTRVNVMGIHFIWHATKGATDNVPVDQGFVAHYRQPLHKCKPQVKDTRVTDKFAERLALRLKEVWSKLKGVSLGWKPATNVLTGAC